LLKRQAERGGLLLEQGAAHAVHADPVVFCRDRRDERRHAVATVQQDLA